MKNEKREKGKRLLDAMSLADEKYVHEAVPGAVRPKRKIPLRMMIIAATLCVVLIAGGLFLFMPFSDEPPEVDGYENSEYYEVIKALQTVTYRSENAGYANWFEKLFGGLLSNGMEDADNMASAPEEFAGAVMDGSTGSASDPGTYEEITDNQVQGVIEADRIKRSSTHIFYLDQKVLKAYAINGNESDLVGLYVFENTEGYFAEWEFYLSDDCKTVTVMIPYSVGRYDTGINIVSLDVTDPANITEKKTVTVTGNYLSSRLTNGTLLLLTRFSVRTNPDFDKEEQFLPQIDCGEGCESIAPEDIYMPDNVSNAMYTVVIKLDEDTLEVQGSNAFLSYSQEAYVSADNVYITRQYRDSKTENGIVTNQSVTEITRVEYSGDTLINRGAVTVEGYIKDQYSLDEKDGILRVITTTDIGRYRESYNGDNVSAELLQDAGTSASLYCIDITNWQTVAKVERFAPQGEIVRSVRFDGDHAYVCTAVQLTDPVFFFDLSDLSDITYKDTGTITGFSTSLINFGDGYLMGIGIGDSWNTLKIEIYVEGESGVESYCSYELENADYSTDYKSYYIDRKNGLVGIGVRADLESRYLLLRFDGYELKEVINTPLSGENDQKRAVYIDGYFYMFGTNDFQVAKINSN